jgi:F0F1-type ATP synthase gamma subunit
MDCKNIDYFLFLKKNYINILSYLTEIINSYEEITSYSDDCIFQYNKYKNDVLEIKYKIHDLNHTISQICCHNFVEDEIDVAIDRSTKIEYCKTCEYTKERGFDS